MAKITPAGELKLAVPAAQDELNPHLAEEVGGVGVLHTHTLHPAFLEDLFPTIHQA